MKFDYTVIFPEDCREVVEKGENAPPVDISEIDYKEYELLEVSEDTTEQFNELPCTVDLVEAIEDGLTVIGLKIGINETDRRGF